jgi:predicted protein tyrosine phosphatase
MTINGKIVSTHIETAKPMFALRVLGLDEAEALIYCGWPTRIISLTNEPDRDYGPHHLHVQVSDVAFVSPDGGSPSIQHLWRVLDFTADLTDADRLLVHCHAGQSRSTAIAIAVCIQHGMTYLEAFDHVARIRTILMPNQLFIQYIDDHFGLDNKLVDYATAHRAAELGRTRLLPSGPPPKAAVDSMMHLLDLMRDET